MNRFTVILASATLLAPAIAGAHQGKHWSEHHASKFERKSEYHHRKVEYYQNKVLNHVRLAHHNARHARRATKQEAAYGKVLSVQPVYVNRGYRHGKDSCLQWSDGYDERHRSWGPTVVGGVIGGAIGYHLGEDHNEPELGTIAGGLLGAATGHGVSRHIYESRHIRVSGPCRPQKHNQRSSEQVEYQVIYRYNGRTYNEQMDYDPGEWVKLNVEASPA